MVVNGALAPEPRSDDDEDQDYAGYVTVNTNGALTVNLDPGALPRGTHTLAARGSWSGVIAAATIVVP